MADEIYIDYAATTPLDEDVLTAMQPYFADRFYNPSANYEAAKTVRKVVNEARKKIAYWLGAKQSEIIFTAGGTEANNLAIQGVMRAYPKGELLISLIEHDSIVKPSELFPHQKVAVDTKGRVKLDDLQKKLTDKTVLVSIIYASSEIGVIEPIKEIAKIIKSTRQTRKTKLPLYLHIDACQAGNYLDLHASRLGVDLMTVNGGKIYGPKQSGFLFVKSDVKLKPLILGGGQERGLRSGTENVPAIVGLAEALDKAQKMRSKEVKRLAELQNYFMRQLETATLKAKINGDLKHRLPNNTHVTFPGQDNERLLILLEQDGILAAAGSACSASSQTPSHVLKAIGLTDGEARSSLRFSMGRKTKKSDIDKIIHSLKKSII